VLLGTKLPWFCPRQLGLVEVESGAMDNAAGVDGVVAVAVAFDAAMRCLKY